MRRGLDGIDMSRVAEDVADERLLRPGMVRLPYGDPKPAEGMKTEQMRKLIADTDAILHNQREHLGELEARWRGPEIERACEALAHSIIMTEAAKGELLKIHGVINYGLGR